MANLTITGYVAPTSLGYGTWSDITPSQGIIRVETERNIDGGDSASITLSDDTDFTEFEEQRAIQIFLDGTTDPTHLIWEGLILNVSFGMHKPWPNMRTYDIQCVGYEKFLMRDTITTVWEDESFNTIFGDIATQTNAYDRFPTVKRFKYDTSKLTNYDAATYTSTISKTSEQQRIWNALKELVPVLDGVNTTHAYEYGLYLDYLQSNSYIYLMPDMLDFNAAATTDFSDDANIYADTKTIRRNYDKLINYSHTIGDGYETVHYHATQLSPVDVFPVTENWNFSATTAPSERAYIAVVIENDGIGFEYGSFSISGWDAVAGNPLSETIYFYAPFNKDTTIYSRERYADFIPVSAFNIRNMSGSLVNVYECTHGIAGRSINDHGICSAPIRQLDMNTQDRVDNFSQQLVRLYHNPVHEAMFRAKTHNTTNYINKTIDLTDDFYDATKRYLVTNQKYVIPQNYDVEMWLTAVYRDIDWE